MGHFPILGLPFALAAASTPPYFQAIKWMLTLAGAVIFAAGAVALDNIIKRQRDKRGHNLT